MNFNTINFKSHIYSRINITTYLRLNFIVIQMLAQTMVCLIWSKIFIIFFYIWWIKIFEKYFLKRSFLLIRKWLCFNGNRENKFHRWHFTLVISNIPHPLSNPALSLLIEHQKISKNSTYLFLKKVYWKYETLYNSILQLRFFLKKKYFLEIMY